MKTRARIAIDAYLARKATGRRTRFTPDRDAETQRDPALPGTVFYRYPDGSAIRLDHGRVSRGGDPAAAGDIQEF